MLHGFLVAGLAPREVALALALGIVIGCFPILGTTTALCVLAAFLTRSNQLVIQAGNYLAYPLYFALLIPQMKLGALIFRSPFDLTIDGIKRAYGRGLGALLGFAGAGLAHAVVAWVLVAPFAAFLLFRALVPIMERLAQRRNL
jgi:uncharacterized protein (DUF2062 family)